MAINVAHDILRSGRTDPSNVRQGQLGASTYGFRTNVTGRGGPSHPEGTRDGPGKCLLGPTL